MRVLVTGASGKVGRATVRALVAAGHDVVATDLGQPVWDPGADAVPYVTADLTDAGAVFGLVGGWIAGGAAIDPRPVDAVVHAGAIPAPGRHAPHHIFRNNLMGTFNIVEACVRHRVTRLVNISSETVPGVIFAERPFAPDYLPIDEDHPARPQDPYALAKLFGEQLCDAATRRSGLRTISLRPTWVQNAQSYAINLGPLLRDAELRSPTAVSYIDADDLADAIRLAVESDLPGHEVFYISAPEIPGGGHTLAEVAERTFGAGVVEIRETDRPDACGTSTDKARRLLGWEATRSWRDHLDEDGNPLA
jgi:UDP-glucose 4-epimerase